MRFSKKAKTQTKLITRNASLCSLWGNWEWEGYVIAHPELLVCCFNVFNTADFFWMTSAFMFYLWLSRTWGGPILVARWSFVQAVPLRVLDTAHIKWWRYTYLSLFNTVLHHLPVGERLQQREVMAASLRPWSRRLLMCTSLKMCLSALLDEGISLHLFKQEIC